MICNHQKLAKTSGSPGNRESINHFKIESQVTDSNQKSHWYLVDLPGYGFAKVSQNQRKKWEKMIENYLRQRENLTHVFVLRDGRHTPQKIDLEFLKKLADWEIPFCLAFTKADKENQRTISANVKKFLETMRKTWQFLPQHFVTSAVEVGIKFCGWSIVEMALCVKRNPTARCCEDNWLAKSEDRGWEGRGCQDSESGA